MTDIITTDHPLTESQRSTLSALLDTLLPASDDGAMPSASDVGFEVFMTTQAADFTDDLNAVLEHFDADFAQSSIAERVKVVTEFSNHNPPLFQALLARVYDCYYQHDQVREQIGVVSGAVFPQGNEVMAGDLSLLDPVISNSDQHGYRKQ